MTSDAALILAAIVAAVGGAVGAASAWALARLRHEPPAIITPNAYREMEAALADMTRQQNETRAQQAADHLTMRQMATQITRLEIMVLRLSEQVRQLGGVPVAGMEPSLAPPAPPDNRTLAMVLASLFNADELADLAMRLDIPDGRIAGETIDAKARALVEYQRRRGVKQTDNLIKLAAELRPDGGLEEWQS
jgi:hypothetical protein